MQQLTHLLSWIVLFGTVVLLQVHGMAFWRSQVGSYGIGWSLLLEVVALWLWARPQWVSRLLGAVASILLLLGPLVQIATPLLDALGSNEHIDAAHEREVSILESQLKALQQQHAAFTENSRLRPGWLPAVQATEDRLTETREHLVRLYRQPPMRSPRRERQTWLVMGMECTGLLLFQITMIAVVLQLMDDTPSTTSLKPAHWFGLRAQRKTPPPSEPVVPALDAVPLPHSTVSDTPTKKRTRTKAVAV
jgi:hypothetical protein